MTSQRDLVMAQDARESDQERGRLELMLRNLRGLAIVPPSAGTRNAATGSIDPGSGPRFS